MYAVYLVIVFFVTCLLALLLLFPFCKVWWIIRSRHPALWASEGPFNFRTMLSSGAITSGFFDLANTLHENKDLQKQDPSLARWSLRCSQLTAMRPRKFMSQVACAAVFLYFVHFFTTAVFYLLGLDS